MLRIRIECVLNVAVLCFLTTVNVFIGCVDNFRDGVIVAALFIIVGNIKNDVK